jgi:hypothetical protein
MHLDVELTPRAARAFQAAQHGGKFGFQTSSSQMAFPAVGDEIEYAGLVKNIAFVVVKRRFIWQTDTEERIRIWLDLAEGESMGPSTTV